MSESREQGARELVDRLMRGAIAWSKRMRVKDAISQVLESPEGAALLELAQKGEALEVRPDPMTLGWMYSYVCNALDEGRDPRKIEVPEILDQAKRDFADTEASP